MAEICRRLDGIPLAIELAAARVRALAVEDIASGSTTASGCSPAATATALPRQQTLRATIDWSHDLLTPQEQALLRRLSVFAGGWTLEAAEAVCAGDGVDESRCSTCLTHLVDKSLVVLEPRATRYRMLETVREYALERLAESREEDAVRGLHLRFYSALAQSAERALYGPDQPAWRARLDKERENVLLAHAHSLGARRTAFRQAWRSFTRSAPG